MNPAPLRVGDRVLVPLSDRRALVRTVHSIAATIYVLPTCEDPDPRPQLRCYSFASLVKVEWADG